MGYIGWLFFNERRLRFSPFVTWAAICTCTTVCAETALCMSVVRFGAAHVIVTRQTTHYFYSLIATFSNNAYDAVKYQKR